MSVGGLVLAAGEGRRFGAPKSLLVVDGERLVDRAAGLLRAGGCAPVFVVSGAVPLHVDDAEVIHNPAWRSGMGSSVRAGLAALTGTAVDAVVIALVDQPWLGPESVRRLIAAHGDGSVLAVATYGGQRGNPVLLARSVWTEVADLAEGDVGARAFIVAHPELVTSVDCTDTGRPDDIDHPADLR